MKKVKKVQKQQASSISLKAKLIICTVLGLILLAAIAIILLENRPGKIIITNNSSLTLQSIEAYFEDSEDVVEMEGLSQDAEGNIITPWSYSDLKPSSKVSKNLEKIYLLGREANLKIIFKFEGYDKTLFVNAGVFYENFDGRIKITFEDSKDEDMVYLKVKASNGILPSPLTICNETHTVYYKEGNIPD